MKRGWTSRDLPVASDDTNLWTVADAVRYLGPLPSDPVDLPAIAAEQKLRIVIRCLGDVLNIRPVGKRRTSPPGHPGRYARVYWAQDFISVYEMMSADERPSAAA